MVRDLNDKLVHISNSQYGHYLFDVGVSCFVLK